MKPASLFLAIGALAAALALPAPAAAQRAPAPVAAAASAPWPAVPPLERAVGDEAQTRRFVLPNGIKVLLWSDPKLNKSSAALAVGVGSAADPRERQGLAHFLEHMLFLGTEKYPDITGFDAYLRRNNGYNNAYTADDHTNYLLEIRHEAFEGALDRFAQFFIAPLMDARFTEREMNAVASEHQKNLENDGWRENQLQRQLYAEGHPLRHFGTGSKETLAGVTRDELLAFYRKHYSADRMTLVLTGNASLDQLERWAREKFSAIPDRKLGPIVYPREVIVRADRLRLQRMEPIKDVRQLSLEFALPPQAADWPHKSAELAAFLVGNEGPGSLLSLLKAEGLATSLGTGVNDATPDNGSFEVNIGLTPKGLEQVPRVLQLFFAQVRLLRESGLPAHVFDERRALARLDERYRDKGEGAALASGLAAALLRYPLEVAERTPYLWLTPDPKGYEAVLAKLVPENAIATIVAKGQTVDRIEPIYGTRYSEGAISGAEFAALREPPRMAALALPAPNPYVPKKTSIEALQPVRLVDEPALSLYHLQDTEFQRPQTAYVLRFLLPRARVGGDHTVRTATLLAFQEACVREALNETIYPAAEAGIGFTFSASLDGVWVATEGWDDGAGRLLRTVVPALADCPIDATRFAALKDRMLRGLAAAERADAYVQLQQTRRATVREFYATPLEMLPVARSIEQNDVRAFARTLFGRGKLEALVHGNVGPTEALALVRRVATTLGTEGVPEAELLRPRQLVAAPGDVVRSAEQLAVNNSALRREYVLGGDDAEARAATHVLSAFISEPFYAELRTRQQLGYIVGSSAFEDERQTVLMFVVQSGDYPPAELEQRAEAFIRAQPAALRAIKPEEWQQTVAGVRAKLLERDKSIAERARRLFGLAYDERADWERTRETLAALATLDPERVAARLERALAPDTRRMRNWIGVARQHGEAAEPLTPIDVRQRWKQARRYE